MENKVYLEMASPENEVNHRKPPSKKNEKETRAKEPREKPLRVEELSARGKDNFKPLVKINKYQLFTMGSTKIDSDGITDLNIYENSEFSKQVTFGSGANAAVSREINTEDGESDYALVTNRSSETVEPRHSKLYERLNFAKSGSSTNQEESSLKQICSRKKIFWKLLLLLSFAAVVIVGAFLGAKLTTVRHGGWSMWEHWSHCSVSCGNGMANRKRTCSDTEPVSGGLYCAGDSVEYRICFNTSCFGNWTAWNQWSKCTVTCGTGLRQRDRSCSAEEVHKLCIGAQFEYAICSQTDCSVVNHGEWSMWEPWGQCSATCGPGMDQRRRPCSNLTLSNGGNFCFGESSEYRLCNIGTCEGNWTDWSHWSLCSASCGSGLRKRDRNCTTKESCIGESTEYSVCSQRDCGVVNGGWSIWEPWSQCSATCGPGMDQRRRSCSNPTPSNGGNFCSGESSEYRLCNRGNCEGNWTDWSQWSLCSVTCGSGLRKRDRNCTTKESCFGESTEYSVCSQRDCGVVNGGWSMWEPWSQCSATCGPGMDQRRRACSNPTPSNGGNFCFGESSEYRLCNIGNCEGNWTAWTQWSMCSVTCGSGIRKRDRKCTTKESCIGESTEYSVCSQRDCGVVNGGWSIWEPWGLCSATCGIGLMRRVRSCSNPKPISGGDFCFGESSEYRLCNTANCEVIHGGWSLWTSWTLCSSSCTKTRTRSCTNPAPSQGGHMCQGDAEDKETCNLYACVFSRMYVRLVDGSSSLNGRLEVSLDNFNWGTVCDDNFDFSDARVVCRMLGYSSTSAVIDSGAIVDGSGPVYLDDLQCNGNETSLLYCQHSGWGRHNCQHSEDVGVSCS